MRRFERPQRLQTASFRQLDSEAIRRSILPLRAAVLKRHEIKRKSILVRRLPWLCFRDDKPERMLLACPDHARLTSVRAR